MSPTLVVRNSGSTSIDIRRRLIDICSQIQPRRVSWGTDASRHQNMTVSGRCTENAGLTRRLLAAQCRLPRQALLEGDAVFTSYKGALTEQFVCQELAAAGIDKAYYWGDAGGRFEVDFVFERDAQIVAAEVKAGTSVASRSFVHFLARHEANVTGLRFSLLPHRAETHLVNIPLWVLAAMP